MSKHAGKVFSFLFSFNIPLLWVIFLDISMVEVVRIIAFLSNIYRFIYYSLVLNWYILNSRFLRNTIRSCFEKLSNLFTVFDSLSMIWFVFVLDALNVALWIINVLWDIFSFMIYLGILSRFFLGLILVRFLIPSLAIDP